MSLPRRTAEGLVAELTDQLEAGGTPAQAWLHVMMSNVDPLALMLELADGICEHLTATAAAADEILITGQAPRPEMQAALDAASELVMARYADDPGRAILALARDPAADALGSMTGALLRMWVEVTRGNLPVDHYYGLGPG